MQVDGTVVMWVFGLVFAAFSGLWGLVWAMLNKRLNSIETQAQIDREKLDRHVAELFSKLEQDREKRIAGEDRIVAEVAALRLSLADMRNGCMDRFAGKHELEALRAELKGQG